MKVLSFFNLPHRDECHAHEWGISIYSALHHLYQPETPLGRNSAELSSIEIRIDRATHYVCVISTTIVYHGRGVVTIKYVVSSLLLMFCSDSSALFAVNNL